MKAIILAGGFATRLWPLTENTAKPLLRVAGKPIISHIVERLPTDISIIVSTNSAFATDFEDWKKDFSDRDIEIFIEDATGEESKKGALAAVALVTETFDIQEDILVLAGDNLFFFDFQKFLQKADNSPLLAAYDVGSLSEAKKFGVVVPGKNQQVKEFQEKPENPKSTLVSTGCLFFPYRLLGELVQFSREHNDDLGGVFEHFLSIGEAVQYFDFSEKWFDIGSFSAFLDAQKYVIGEQVIEGDDGDHRPHLDKKKNTFSGSVYLGEDVVVENSFLENVIVESGCSIRDATIRNSVVGKDSVVSGVDVNTVALRENSFVTVE